MPKPNETPLENTRKNSLKQQASTSWGSAKQQESAVKNARLMRIFKDRHGLGVKLIDEVLGVR